MLIAKKLRCEYLNNAMGIDFSRPRLSWLPYGNGKKQIAYQIIAETKDQSWDSGKQESNQTAHIPCELDLRSRDIVSWKVRLWDEAGEGDWSNSANFEMGLLQPSDWQATWIQPEIHDFDSAIQQPASILRKEFDLTQMLENSRLYVTACGVYQVFLNGKRVGNQALTPGHTEYEKRIQYQTYDVTGLLQPGRNVIHAYVGDGWFRGSKGNSSVRNVFGKKLAFLAQLEAGDTIITTDLTWKATQEGPLRENDTKFGETFDARKLMNGIEKPGFDDSDWHEVAVFEWPMEALIGTRSVPIAEYEMFRPKVLLTPNGQTVLDFGQNISGYVSFQVRGTAGSELRLIHGEVLDEYGNFTLENVDNTLKESKPQSAGADKTSNKGQDSGTDKASNSEQPSAPQRPARSFQLPEDIEMSGFGPAISLQQKVTYILSGRGEETYKPMMSCFGFRYVLLEGWPEEPSPENFIAYAVYSLLEETLDFDSSNPLINRLVHNTIWSQKGNFVDVPTDCPTRERCGYTGDAQVFVDTGNLLVSGIPFYRKWLSDLAATQNQKGKVANIAPRQSSLGKYTIFDGSSGWGDAAVIIPHYLYQHYADPAILEEFYPMMKGWVDYEIAQAKNDNPANSDRNNPYHEYLWDTGFHWGEWLEPRDPNEPYSASHAGLGAGKPEEATAFLSYSARLLSADARLLGKEEDAAYYAEVSEKARKAYLFHNTDNGLISGKRQCLYVRPLKFNLLDKEDKATAAASLNEIVIANGYHLNTGFLSTPYLCEMLASYGYEDTAFEVLFQEAPPSWLYAVKKGCTTIPENWNCYTPEGKPEDSFNHYAYGSIVGWILRYIIGINPEPIKRHFTIAPHPCGERLNKAEVRYRSVIGEIGVRWDATGTEFILEVEVPANCTASVILPDGRRIELEPGKHRLSE